ncbi:MAG TPA: hypothetical protein VMU83_05165 [Hanamia sp.]|nr:hypothetical protein [Hanamia sp.]
MAVLNILPECYVDTKVAEIITRSSEKYNHQHGCGQIANLLKRRLKDTVALGIIDEDKNKGPIANYFLEFDEIKSENDLILKKHKDRKQYLILICPEIEKWLLMNANSVHLNLSDFNLPSDLNGFKQITKTQDIDSNLDFYQFIKALIDKKSAGIITFGNWVSDFKNNTFDNLNH